jgi:hypothetical protein
VNEHEVKGPTEAAFFVATEVVNEYHSFPVVQRADIVGSNCLFMKINDIWFQVSFTNVIGRRLIERLEHLAEVLADDLDDDEDDEGSYNPEDYPEDEPRDQLDYPHNQIPEP